MQEKEDWAVSNRTMGGRGGSLSKFNSLETKIELTEFATGITSECGIPEIKFNADGIARHRTMAIPKK